MMEHYDIEDAFNRIAPTQLKFAISEIHSLSAGGAKEDFYLAFFLSNEDRSSACAPYIWIDQARGGRPFLKVENLQTSVLASSVNGTRQVLWSSSQVFVHPGMALLGFYLNIRVIERPDGKNYINGQRPHEASVSFMYGFGCQNSRMSTGRFELKGALLSDLVDKGMPHGELVRRINQHSMTVARQLSSGTAG
jgi:hypothetical protein